MADSRDRCPDCGSEGCHRCGEQRFACDARHVEVGDLLSWCGRWVEVGEVKQASGYGRYFHVHVPGHGDLRLHYFYNERVEVRRSVRRTDNGASYRSYGSIDGHIEGINLHDRKRFWVYDALTGRRVTCEFGDRIEIERIADALAKKRRVEVYGTVSYRTDDQIASMLADTLYVFPDASTLPTADDVRGILG